jgi:ribosomal protein S6
MQSTDTREEKEAARLYELAYLVSPTVSEDKLNEVVGRIKAVFEKQGIFVTFEEFPKFRQLAYTLIKPLGGKNEKYANAYFGWMKFETAGASLTGVKVSLEKEADIIRFLLVKVGRDQKTSMRAPLWRRDAPKRETVKTETPKGPAMSEAEIEKTIEELIVE